jgi:transcriptional regulator with XRE-family HTH domain
MLEGFIMKFGERLKSERIKKGFTQEELGNIVNKSKNNISQYERGIREPDLNILRRFSEIFDCTLDYLLGNTDNPKTIKIDDIPEQLKNLGVEYYTVIKDAKEKGISPDDLNKIIKAIEAIK